MIFKQLAMAATLFFQNEAKILLTGFHSHKHSQQIS